ncbi:endonuclease/exonuclease/phosphatase family protein, partial [Thiolapillus sp.]|uniref:endonuclease/exonuclease/phosphatase family protein n=1 Tax=Thiolapillus sp. TaxID=2017437 RepID=UPI003AF70CFE
NFKVAFWNVRSMQDSEDRPQRRSALVAGELARLDIDIAALREDEVGYTLFWSGKNKDERRLSGVGVMIKTSIVRKLQNLPVGHSDASCP